MNEDVKKVNPFPDQIKKVINEALEPGEITEDQLEEASGGLAAMENESCNVTCTTCLLSGS